MSSCYLRVGGKELNVDAYLKEHPCQVSGLHRLGEPRYKNKPDGPKLDHSGFNICVSDARFEDLKQQIHDAVVFLKDKEHSEQISTLLAYPGVEDVTLDFGVARDDRDEFPVKWYSFPPEFIQLAGSLGLGLEITFY
jgi:hypothetical protein